MTTAPLSSTAKQRDNVLEEGLRALSQSFNHRQIRQQLVAQLLHCHTVAHCHHRRLDQFAGIGRQNLRADQPTSLLSETSVMEHVIEVG